MRAPKNPLINIPGATRFSSVGGLGIGRASAQLLAVADADDVSAAVATAISYTNLWLFDCHFFHCSDYPSYILSVFLYDLQ